jgi:hypothetical protein
MTVNQEEQTTVPAFKNGRADIGWWVRATIGSVVGLLVFIFGLWIIIGLIGPRLNLYKAETSKRERIAEARAEADAELYRADAEVRQARRHAERDRIRARGIADANAIINESLTAEYLQYYWIEGVRESDAQLIYVPVDPASGLPTLPVTEAGRAVPQE